MLSHDRECEKLRKFHDLSLNPTILSRPPHTHTHCCEFKERVVQLVCVRIYISEDRSQMKTI